MHKLMTPESKNLLDSKVCNLLHARVILVVLVVLVSTC